MRCKFIAFVILFLCSLTAFADECNQYARTPKFDVCEQTINTYNDAFGRRPSADEIKFWVGQNNMNYDWLINNHRTFLKSNTKERQDTIKRSYQAIFNRLPNDGELKYWDGQVASTGATYKELLGYHRQYQAQQAKTQPVVPTTTVASSLAKTPQNGWDKMLNQWERCFGGVGPGCGGVPGLAPVTKNADGSVTTYVAVGSILHDNCCLRNGNSGTWCGELNPQNVIMDELSLKHLVGNCAQEWSKAVYNVRDRRWWAHTFGPYKGTDGGDDLTPTTNRHAKMSVANSPLFVDYTGGETIMTRSLKAPNGTNLDIDDEEFCESGHFVEVHNLVVGVGRWGVCGPANVKQVSK
jgi:hypothetical protein